MSGLPADVEKDKQEFEDMKRQLEEAGNKEKEQADKPVPAIAPETEASQDEGIKASEEPKQELEPATKEAPSVEVKEPETQTQEDDKLQASSPEKDSDPQYWKSRAYTIAGEHRKARTENEQLVTENANLRAEVERQKDLTARSAEPKPIAVESPIPDPGYVSDDLLRSYYSEEEQEEYGEDFCRINVAKMEAVADRKMKDMSYKVDNMQRTAEEREFWLKVEGKAPGSNVFHDPDNNKFWGWMEEPVPLTGKTRKEIAQQAVDEQNPQVLADLVKAYKTDTEQPPEESKKREIPQNEDIQPHSASGNPDPSVKQKPVYSQAQVDKFYEDCIQGRVTPEEKHTIEQQIHEAAKDGRIKP